MVFQDCFMGVSKVFEGCKIVFERCYMDILFEFQQCLKWCHENNSMELQEYFNFQLSYIGG